MFLLKSVENLKEVELKTLERKNPKVKKVISELRVPLLVDSVFDNETYVKSKEKQSNTHLDW